MATVRQARPEDAVGFYEQAGYGALEAVEHEPSGPQDVTLECVRMARPLVENE